MITKQDAVKIARKLRTEYPQIDPKHHTGYRYAVQDISDLLQELIPTFDRPMFMEMTGVYGGSEPEDV